MRQPLLIPLLPFLLLSSCKKTGDAAAGDAGATGTSGTSSVIAAVASALGIGFEGDVTMHVTSSHGPPEDLTFHVKGQKLRVDVPSHGAEVHVIFDQAANKTYAILDPMKMYAEFDHATMQAAAAHAPAPKVTETGKHETVAGTDCEDWEIVEAGDKHATACVAHGISFFDFSAMRPGGATTATGWIEELRAKQAFPLKAVELDASGKELSRMEVTKIEKKPLDDALFTLPAGYRSMSSMVPGLAPHAPAQQAGAPPPHLK
jgi:hypothetical protein